MLNTSCSNETNQNRNEMKVTTTETKNGGTYLTYQSESKSVSELTSDLEKVLEKLNSKELISSQQILFYIDATNGNIFISGFDAQSGDVYDDKGIWIELQELWDDNNAMDFDEFVTESIKKALKTKIGKRTSELFEIYYQTEMDEPKKVK
jgi:hypothetical protein